MMKTKLLLLAALMLVATAGISQAKTDKPPKGDTVVTIMMPPEASFNTLKKGLKDVSWKKIVFSQELKPARDFVGYQIGVLFANWSVAAASKDQAMLDTISSNIIKLTKNIDIDDDAVLINVKKRIEKFSDYLKDDSTNSYQKISSEIRYIRDEVKTYYSKSGNKTMVDQIGFGAWLEFLYIGLQGVNEKYDPKITTVFNRSQEVDYFLRLADADPKLAPITGFLKSIKPKLTLRDGKTLSKKDVAALLAEIKSFRVSLAKVPAK